MNDEPGDGRGFGFAVDQAVNFARIVFSGSSDANGETALVQRNPTLRFVDRRPRSVERNQLFGGGRRTSSGGLLTPAAQPFQVVHLIGVLVRRNFGTRNGDVVAHVADYCID